MEEEKKKTKTVEKKEEAKKVETTAKVENKKSRNMIMIAIAIVVAVVLVAIVAYIIMNDSPKKVVENTLNQLKIGAYKQEILAGLTQGESTLDTEAQKLLFEKLEWKILEVKEEGEKTTVEIEITNKDFKTIMGNYMQKALKAAFSGQSINEEQMTNYLMEELKNEEIATVTNNESIVVEKQNGKWKITDEEAFVYSVLPGLSEAMDALT